MALPQAWVDHLFAKLTVRYGAPFQRQWPDADVTLVKADWAEVLDGTSGDAIAYALRHLPEKPPNVIQFRDLCRRGAPDRPALPAPVETPDKQRVDAALERMRAVPAAVRRKSKAQECIDRIEACVAANGGRMSAAQRHLLEHCLRMPETSTRLPLKADAEVAA